MVGYNKDLFILPFDHRSSFVKNMFGVEGREPTEEEKKKVKKAKAIIYEGFKKSIAQGIPKESAAILLDEQFGDELLRDAHQNGYTIILTTEKSGQKEFMFEYGPDFANHIKNYDPTFVKALVQYNPEGDQDANSHSRAKLAELTLFCYQQTKRLLIEPLIPATPEQLDKVGGDKDRYDNELRPELTVKMIKEMQEGNVNPDVWKLEGMNREEDYQIAVKQARFSGRDSVGIVILGRAAETPVVENWVRVGARVDGVIGFAIGRTIFWDPLTKFKDGKASDEEAASEISEGFLHYYNIFKEARQI